MGVPVDNSKKFIRSGGRINRVDTVSFRIDNFFAPFQPDDTMNHITFIAENGHDYIANPYFFRIQRDDFYEFAISNKGIHTPPAGFQPKPAVKVQRLFDEIAVYPCIPETDYMSLPAGK
jgi:hypothetical protein